MPCPPRAGASGSRRAERSERGHDVVVGVDDSRGEVCDARVDGGITALAVVVVQGLVGAPRRALDGGAFGEVDALIAIHDDGNRPIG